MSYFKAKMHQIQPRVHHIWMSDSLPCITCILSEIKNLTSNQAMRTNMHHRAKFRKERSNRCGDIAIFCDFQTGFADIILRPNDNERNDQCLPGCLSVRRWRPLNNRCWIKSSKLGMEVGWVKAQQTRNKYLHCVESILYGSIIRQKSWPKRPNLDGPAYPYAQNKIARVHRTRTDFDAKYVKRRGSAQESAFWGSQNQHLRFGPWFSPKTVIFGPHFDGTVFFARKRL